VISAHRRRRRSRILALFASILALNAHPLGAQQRAEAVYSVGWPSRLQPYVGGFGLRTRDVGGSGAVVAGIDRPLMNPVTGLLGIAGEGYAQFDEGRQGVGVRAMATVPALGLRAGVDWNLRSGDVDPMYSLVAAVRRGGIFGRGTMVRLDWLPTRAQTVGLGVTLPLMQPQAGRTREKRVTVQLPYAVRTAARRDTPLPETARAALQQVAAGASRLGAYSSVYDDASERRLRDAPDFATTQRDYLAALAQAFGAAAGGAATGDSIAARARAGLLDEVLLPYDALYGRPKSGSLDGFTTAAQAGFERWARDSARLAGPAYGAVIAVHARWMDAIRQVHAELRRGSESAHAVWLPLQLALAPEEYDEQAEVDALMARLVGRPFSDGNAISYLRSSDLPLEIARSIYAARDYHVLWMHDFTGLRDGTKSIDEVGFSMVVDAYLPALTAAVRRYDSLGTFPQYFILLDQFFAEQRDGAMWMKILENPLDDDMTLPGDGNGSRVAREGSRRARLRMRQDSLRLAVQRSLRLRNDANANGGERWLRKVVKVHVNVIYPSDFTFRSARTVPPFWFTPDNVIRDHRKIVFYDLNEADPYRGAALLMGVGIGEHYASATWEDRGHRVRGPAALEARDAVRRLLRAQGFREDQIPVPLRPVADTANAERRTDRGDYVGRALQVHNEAGFGRKESSVSRALLYTLAAPGSVVIATDPLWLSSEWAGLLAAAAARGARVHVIAPALENAPSPQAPLMALAHDVLARLLALRDALAPQLRASGGELRLGIFAARADVHDVAGRAREIREGLARAPWIRALIPFDARALATLDAAESQTAADGADATSIAKDETPRPPQLHQKTLLVARPGAIAALARQPGWERVLADAMRAQSRETARFAEQMTWTTPSVDESAVRRADAMLEGYERAIPDADRRRVSFHFSVGTQNHDPRGLLLDAEASLITSGVHSSAGLVDLYYVMARSRWVNSLPELERHLPRQSWAMHRLARLVRPAL